MTFEAMHRIAAKSTWVVTWVVEAPRGEAGIPSHGVDGLSIAVISSPTFPEMESTRTPSVDPSRLR
jgi:hypothetical protein